MSIDTEKFLEKLIPDFLISDLRKDIKAELLKIKSSAEMEFRNADEKIIEIETSIVESKNLEPLKITGCIFFADTQNSFGDLYGEPNTLPHGPFFLRVPYEDFTAYLNKNFQGDGFTYQLKPNYQFVEAEHKIFRLSQIYKVPFKIFSPYARRAVDIRIAGKSKEDFTRLADLNFKLAENNLQGKLLMNEKFYWNVKIKSCTEQWQHKVGDLYEYGYTDGIDAATYIVPNSDANLDDELEFVKADGQIILKTPREFPDGECDLIKILPLKSKIHSKIFSKPRLRTAGDINFVLKCLSRENYSCRFGKFGGNANVKRYSGEHKYFTSADENLLRAKRQLPTCSVKFSGDELFLTDYANYVLNFLEERYPEFNWAGERDE